MINGVAMSLFGWVIFGLFILHIVNYHWFKIIVKRGVTVLFFLGGLIGGVLYGLVLALPTIVEKSLKGGVVGLVLFVLLTIYLITAVVPFIGRYTLKTRSQLEEYVSTSFVERALDLREIMIDIVAEHYDRELVFEEREQYREELHTVKQQGKARLDTGETVLSVVLGAVLIGSTVSGIDLFQWSFYQYSFATVVEIWLLMIAVSIIYRSSVLELIAYSADAEFESIEEFDAALSYQKGVSLHGFFQGLTAALFIAYAAASVRYEIIRDLLEAKYTDQDWISMAIERLFD